MTREEKTGVSPEAPGELARETKTLLGPYLHRKRFRAGELLWREGDTDGMLVFLESGTVKIYRLLPDGRTVTLFLFGPETVFGFMPFLDGEPYPAYAQALEDAEARIMPRSSLLGALKQDPQVAVFLLQHLSRRLRVAVSRTVGTAGCHSAAGSTNDSPRYITIRDPHGDTHIFRNGLWQTLMSG